MKSSEEQKEIIRKFLNENVPCFNHDGAGQRLEVDWDFQHSERASKAPEVNIHLDGACLVKKVHLSEDASEDDKRAALEVGGARFNEGKVRFDLMPPDALWELAKVYTFGAKKYKDRNWEKGMAWGICFAAAMRHLWKWWRGERNDPESGIHHLAHAAWNCLSALAYEMRGQTEFDDRYKPGQPGGFGLPHD